MVLFITSSCKPLEADPSREVCTYATCIGSISLANKRRGKLTCVCYCELENVVILTGLSLDNKQGFYVEWYAKLKKIRYPENDPTAP